MTKGQDEVRCVVCGIEGDPDEMRGWVVMHLLAVKGSESVSKLELQCPTCAKKFDMVLQMAELGNGEGEPVH